MRVEEKKMINDMTNVVLPGMRFTVDGENGINLVHGCSDRIYYTDSSREYGLFKSYDEFPKIHFLRDWDYLFCYADIIDGNGKFLRIFIYIDKDLKKFYYNTNSYGPYGETKRFFDIDHVKLISVICWYNVLYQRDIESDGLCLKEIKVDEFHSNVHELVKIGDDIYLTNYITLNKGIECRNINNEYDKKYVTSYEPIKTSRFLIAGYCSYNGRKKMFFYDSLLDKYYAYPYDTDYNWGEVVMEITEIEVDKEHPLFILLDECDVIPLLDDNELNAKIIHIPLYYSNESLDGFDSKILEFYKNL